MHSIPDLPQPLRQEVVKLLTPYLSTEPERRALLHQALPHAVYQQIDWQGDVQIFTTMLVVSLLQSGEIEAGKQALVALLEVIHDQIDTDQQHEINRCIATLAGWTPITSATSAVPTQTRSEAMQPNNVTNFHQPVQGPVHTGSGDLIVNPPTPTYLDTLLETMREWNETIFHWSEASEEAKASWDARVRHAMSALAARLSVRGLLSLLMVTALGTVTVWWVSPILRWPLADPSARLLACLQYAIGSILIPLAIAIVTQPVQTSEFPQQIFQQQMLLTTVKFTEAVTGFLGFSGLMLIVAISWYHLGGAPLALPIRRAMALLALFFTYIAARRFPINRYQPVNGTIKLHEIDRFFLLTCTPFGLVAAGAIYWGHDLITHWTMGLAVTLGFIGLLIWELRQRTPTEFSDPVMILLLGGILPGAIFVLAVFFALPRSSLPPNREWFYVTITAAYFLSSTLLLATLFVRNKPVLRLPGVFGAFCLLWGLVLVAKFNIHWARALSIILIVLWLGWGQRYFRRYLWFHPSFWVMGGGLFGSLAVALLTTFPLWANTLAFVFLTGILIAWAYYNKRSQR